MSAGRVTVIGGGICGAACAVALRSAGVPVLVVDRGRALGGRLASPEIHGRRVDLGAGYFTVRDDGFREVVDRWGTAGLARPWTDTFGVLTPGEAPGTTTGPVRWAAPGGLRSLVRELLAGTATETNRAVDEMTDLAGLGVGSGDVVVLAMPDPQASRLVEVPDAVPYLPTVTLACGFASRQWPFTDAAFVHDHPDLEFVADDGARRGDGAPVLVAHSTPDFARRHLDDPEAAIAPMVAALRELLGVGDPVWTHIHRWTFAKPDGRHEDHFGVLTAGDGIRIGLAGDQWCPRGAPRVESAWRSGTELAAALLPLLS